MNFERAQNKKRKQASVITEEEDRDISILANLARDLIPSDGPPAIRRRRVRPPEPVLVNEEIGRVETGAEVDDSTIDQVEREVGEVIDAVKSGAPDQVVGEAADKLVKLIQATSSTNLLRDTDPRTERIRQGIEFITAHLERGEVIDEQFKRSFATIMNYSGEEKALAYAQLSIDLVMNALTQGEVVSPALNEYIQRENVRGRKLSKTSLGVIQRRLYDIIRIVNSFSASFPRHGAKMTVHDPNAPYTRAYHKYFNDNNPDNKNIMTYLVPRQNMYMMHNVKITKGEFSSAMTIYATGSRADMKPATVFYHPSVYSSDPAFIEALKTTKAILYNTLDHAEFLTNVEEIASQNFFGRGDITSLALRMVKVFKVYSQSQEWKKTYGTNLRGTGWWFYDAISTLKESGNDRFKNLGSVAKKGVWVDDGTVGANTYSRALWYLSSYLGYGKKATPDGYRYEQMVDSGLIGTIGKGSMHEQPSRWLVAFYSKISPTETDLSDPQLLSNFLQGEDGELLRYVATEMVNPINLKSEAGIPYPPRVKKIDAFADIFVMADRVYSAINIRAMSQEELEREFPELFCVVVKPKAEVFPFETPVPPTGSGTSAEIQEASAQFKRSNQYLPKGRGIYVPCSWAAIPFGFITSYISHLYDNKFAKYHNIENLSQLYEYELNDLEIPLKDYTMAYGTFDLFFRRVQSIYPFNTDFLRQVGGYLAATYSDNFYLSGVVAEAFQAESDTLCYRYHNGQYIESKDMLVMQGERVYISADGEKAEAATDEFDCQAYLKAFCDFFMIPPDVANFIDKAARFGVNGGHCVFGNKQFRLPWQGSGNQLTFTMNDFKMAQIVHHYTTQTPYGKERKIHWPTLKTVATYYGMSITLERLITLPPIGEPIVTAGQTLDVDLLGYSATVVVAGAYEMPVAPVVCPILAKERRLKALAFSKAIGKTKDDALDNDEPQQQANYRLNFAIRALSLLLSGCILEPVEREVCYTGILDVAEDLNYTFGTQDLSTLSSVNQDIQTDLITMTDLSKSKAFKEMLTAISDPLTLPEQKREILEKYFIIKYTSLVSYPTSYKVRTSHLLVPTRNVRMGAADPLNYHLWPLKLVSYLAVDKPQTKLFSEKLYQAVAHVDKTFKEPWPAEFTIANTGVIKRVKFLKEPDMDARIRAIADFASPGKVLGVTLLEKIRETLRWYLIDHPYRARGYDSALIQRAAALQKYLAEVRVKYGRRRQIGDGITTEDITNTIFETPSLPLKAGDGTYRDTIGGASAPFMVSTIMKLHELAESGPTQKVEVPVRNRLRVVTPVVLEPGISLDFYSLVQHNEIPYKNYTYDPKSVIYKPNYSRMKQAATYYRAAIIDLTFHASRQSALVSYINGLTKDEFVQLLAKSSYEYENELPPYRSQMVSQVPLRSSKAFADTPVHLQTYGTFDKPINPLTKQYIENLKFEDKYLIPAYYLCLTGAKVPPMFEYGTSERLEPHVAPKVIEKINEFASTEEGFKFIGRFIALMNSLTPTEDYTRVNVASFTKNFYSNPTTAFSAFESNINSTLIMTNRSGPIDIKEIIREMVSIGKLDPATYHNALLPRLKRVLWIAVDRSLFNNVVRIVELGRLNSKVKVKIGVTSAKYPAEAATVWECCYAYHLYFGVNASLVPK